MINHLREVGSRVEEQELENALLEIDDNTSISCIICQCTNEGGGSMQGRQATPLLLLCSTHCNHQAGWPCRPQKPCSVETASTLANLGQCFLGSEVQS